MGKIGVAVGEDFPLQDLDGEPSNPTQEDQAGEDRTSKAASGVSGGGHAHEQCEFASWKWRREGQRAWDDDVHNEQAEWEARKCAFKDKIRAAVRDAVHANDDRGQHRWRHSWRSIWPSVAGIGIAALALAIHRRNHHRRASGCHYYNDSDIETPRRSPRASSARPASEDVIITPPPPREH